MSHSKCLLSLVSVLALAGSGVQAQNRFDPEKTRTALTGLIESALAERGVASVSIALVKEDAIVWKAAFGYANVRTRTPATPATLYSTGSTFKSATAAAVMQLVEQGKCKLEDPINDHLGEFRVQDRLQGEQPVNFIHILSHWSGLSDHIASPPIWGRELPRTLEQLAAGLYSIRAPEKKWEYNNSAYGVAGLLVQRISGVEYEKYLVENLLAPLGVRTPHPVYPTAQMVELMALPYEPGGEPGQAKHAGPPKPVAQVHYDVYPAGDIWLTAEDMARFLGALINGGVFNGHRILSEASVQAMRTARFGGTYGFGLDIAQDAAGHTIIEHTGGIPGFSSLMKGDVTARVGVYIMSNSGVPEEIADAALKLLRGEKF